MMFSSWTEMFWMYYYIRQWCESGRCLDECPSVSDLSPATVQMNLHSKIAIELFRPKLLAVASMKGYTSLLCCNFLCSLQLFVRTSQTNLCKFVENIPRVCSFVVHRSLLAVENTFCGSRNFAGDLLQKYFCIHVELFI